MATGRHRLLESVRVVDFTRAMAGPYCTMLLADMGADVIKIEAPTGDHIRGVGPFDPEDEFQAYGGYFQSLNRNKRSVVIDLKSDRGAETARRIVSTADVCIENFRTGVMDRLGLSYETLIADNPRLVYGSVRGFGDPRGGESPYNDRPAFDLIVQAMGGPMAITGLNGPTRIGPGIGDTFPAALLTSGILGAVISARSTGHGGYVDVSMYDAMISLCERIFYQHSYIGVVSGPSGNDHPFFTPLGVYRTRDGSVALAAHHDQFWKLLTTIMGQPELATDPRYADNKARCEHRAEVTELIESWTLSKTNAEMVDLLDGKVPIGPVNTVVDILADEHVRKRDMIIELDHPGLSTPRKIAGQAIKFVNSSSEPPSDFRRAPLLGEHTREVLAESGFAEAEVAELEGTGVVGRPAESVHRWEET